MVKVQTRGGVFCPLGKGLFCLKVLLVDDDRLALDGIRRMLHWDRFDGVLAGYATSGEEAMEMIQEERPDVVISDIRMPGMDGLELARYLWQNCPGTRMILISGHGEFEYAQQALQYQVTDYILKPITRAKLNSLEERLEAIQQELAQDIPPWYACDDELHDRVDQALRKGDMAAMAELLISPEVSQTLGGRRDVLGIQLLNYLFSYQQELGKDRDTLEAVRQQAMTEYWKLTTQQERLAYLATQYYDLMEYAEVCKGEYSNPIVAYCLEAIQNNYSDSNFNISNLAETLHLSLPYLSTVFKNTTGQTISGYLAAQRLHRARELLRDASVSIRDVCFSSGYDDPRYFAKLFRKHTGMTPSEFRNLYAGSTAGVLGQREAAP